MYAQLGVTIPRDATPQFNAGTPVTRVRDLRKGDLVFFRNKSGSIHHVGIYSGKGQMIDSPRTGQPVQISSITRGIWGCEVPGGRRDPRDAQDFPRRWQGWVGVGDALPIHRGPAGTHVGLCAARIRDRAHARPPRGCRGSFAAAEDVLAEVVDDPPTAKADIATVTSRAGDTVMIPVLDNDSDADGGTLVVESVDQPVHGSLPRWRPARRSPTTRSTTTWAPTSSRTSSATAGRRRDRPGHHHGHGRHDPDAAQPRRTRRHRGDPSNR